TELADVPLDRLERADLRRRRELPGDRPARVAPDDPEAPLQREVVDLDDHAVDLEVQRSSAVLPGQALRDHRVLLVEQLDVRVDAEAVLAQPLERLVMGRERDALDAPDAVAP